MESAPWFDGSFLMAVVTQVALWDSSRIDLIDLSSERAGSLESAVVKLVASASDEHGLELWLESAELSSCDSSDRLLRVHDNCDVRELVDDNNCRNFHRSFSPAPDSKSTMPCADDEIVDVVAVVVVAIALLVQFEVRLKHLSLAECLIAFD